MSLGGYQSAWDVKVRIYIFSKMLIKVFILGFLRETLVKICIFISTHIFNIINLTSCVNFVHFYETPK